MTNNIAAAVTVLALTLASGVIHGRLVSRFGVTDDVQVAADKMAEMPTSFGSWDLVSASELDETSQRMLEPYGYQGGTYTNRDTGAQVSAYLLLGPPGTVAVHTPEVCFSGRDYRLLREREVFPVPNPDGSDSSHTLWCTIFKRTDVNGYIVPAYYAWTAGDTWTASSDARTKFIGHPYIYKVQVSCSLPPSVLLPETDPCQDFLTDFITAAAPYLVVYDK